MRIEIGAVFRETNDREWLVRLRQWITDNRSLLERLDVKVVVAQHSALEALLAWRGEQPRARFALAVGFSRGEVESAHSTGIPAGEPIIIAERFADSGVVAGTASFFDHAVAVSCRDVVAQVRKSLIRAALRKRIEIRTPRSEQELSGYFALRYKVWKSVGYLRSENTQTRTEWEIDIWDRTAVPLCAIASNGTVVGCARLISSSGDEEPAHVSRIEKLLDQAKDAKLSKLFEVSKRMQQPFDLLEEFPEYRPHFRSLIQCRANVAEIGRVAVDPDRRGRCIAEALVDTAVSCAEARGLSCLFLACHEQLASLYSKCGFSAVPGLRSNKFFNIQLPSIVMERRLKPVNNRVAA
jgi:predicted GNAT family N-acyltransferase